MQAAIYERCGQAADVLRIAELPTPEPGPGEVRVKLAWSGVNPSDVKNRAGYRTTRLAYPRIVPHSDGAGFIDAVGSGVAPERVGERVWVWNAAWARADGTAAEYVVLPAAQAVRLPEHIDLAAGACLGIPALTAYHAVHVDGGVAGKTVLVAGGAGAVGHYAVQMAKLAGAERVIATVSSADKAAAATAAGADVVLDYRQDPVEARITELTAGEGVDRIIEVEFSGNAERDLNIIRKGGEIVVYGSDAAAVPLPFFPAVLKHVAIRFFIVYTLSEADRAAALAGLTALLERDALIHNVALRLPLERIAEAHDLVEQRRVLGNVVVGPAAAQE